MIRKYRPTDDDAIVDVWFQAASLAHPFVPQEFMESEKKNTREIYLPNTDTWVYLEQDEVVGFIAMMGNEVGAIFLLPSFHGKGIGTKLMNHVAQFHEILEVEVFEKNSIGRAFYERYGFEFIKKHVHDATGEVLLRLRYSS